MDLHIERATIIIKEQKPEQDPMTGIDNEQEFNPEAEIAAADEEYWQGRAEEAVALEDAIERDANSRRLYLRKLVGEVGDQRMMEGFAVNHQRTPRFREGVENKNFKRQGDAQETLNRACGVCALAPNCTIKGDLGAWIATHPYANSDNRARYTAAIFPKIKRAEGRIKFLKRLFKDPMADCVPEPENPAASKKKLAA